MTITGFRAPTAAFDLVVVIGSLGGLASASTVLSGLPADFPVPVLLLQHGARRDGAEVLAPLLQRRTNLAVHTARSGEQVSGPGVLVVPSGGTATLDEELRLSLEPAVRGGGGDTLLSSAAAAVGSRLIGVILTGRLNDGVEGVRAVKRHGGRVIVEDPRTARSPSMPSQAIATGCVDFALPNRRLAAGLIALALAPGGSDMFSVPTPSWATLCN